MSGITSDMVAAIIGTVLAVIGIFIGFIGLGGWEQQFRSIYLLFAGIAVGLPGLTLLGAVLLEQREVKYWHANTFDTIVLTSQLVIIAMVLTGLLTFFVSVLFPISPR